jgi:hypothetical protein
LASDAVLRACVFRCQDCHRLGQPAAARATIKQTSTAAPKLRRHGFTPRTISSPAHTTRAAVVTTVSQVFQWPGGRTTHRRSDAPIHTARGRLGNCATTIRPVIRLRKTQSRAERADLIMRMGSTLAGCGTQVGQSSPIMACRSVPSVPTGCGRMSAHTQLPTCPPDRPASEVLAVIDLVLRVSSSLRCAAWTGLALRLLV